MSKFSIKSLTTFRSSFTVHLEVVSRVVTEAQKEISAERQLTMSTPRRDSSRRGHHSEFHHFEYTWAYPLLRPHPLPRSQGEGPHKESEASPKSLSGRREKCNFLVLSITSIPTSLIFPYFPLIFLLLKFFHNLELFGRLPRPIWQSTNLTM